MTTELSRHSALASRHKALGSGLEDWNGMGTAWSYNSNPDVEHDAIREKAGMFDMSPLKKVFVRGKDAAKVLDHLTTRNMGGIAPGQSAYLCVLTEDGTIGDDAIVSNNGSDEWMIVHGSGQTMELLEASASGKSASLDFTDALHNVSVQGPAALELLNAASDTDLSRLKYFEHTAANLYGHKCRISRTGYSGERGYEIFIDESSVCDVWDALTDAGVMPCSFASLDKVRIEAGLLFYGYDMTTDNSPWEVGLGFTVAKDKTGFRGAEACQALQGQEKIINVCLDIEHDEMIEGGEALVQGQTSVGTVNSPCYSKRLEKSLALAHVTPEFAKPGTPLSLSTSSGSTLSATVVATPIYDPEKSRTHA